MSQESYSLPVSDAVARIARILQGPPPGNCASLVQGVGGASSHTFAQQRRERPFEKMRLLKSNVLGFVPGNSVWLSQPEAASSCSVTQLEHFLSSPEFDTPIARTDKQTDT